MTKLHEGVFRRAKKKTSDLDQCLRSEQPDHNKNIDCPLGVDTTLDV